MLSISEATACFVHKKISVFVVWWTDGSRVGWVGREARLEAVRISLGEMGVAWTREAAAVMERRVWV